MKKILVFYFFDQQQLHNYYHNIYIYIYIYQWKFIKNKTCLQPGFDRMVTCDFECSERH